MAERRVIGPAHPSGADLARPSVVLSPYGDETGVIMIVRHPRVALVGLASFLLAANAVPSLGDEIVLKSGGKLMGKAFREEGRVRVELEEGVLIFPEEVVVRIVPGISPAELKARMRQSRLDWVDQRLATAGLEDAQRLYSIAENARHAGFPEEEVRTVLGLVLGADADHAGARFDLGEVRYEGRWVTRAQARELAREDHAREMRSGGFILYDDEWLMPPEIDWREHQKEWQRAIDIAESQRDDALGERDGLIAERDAARNEANDVAGQLALAQSERGGPGLRTHMLLPRMTSSSRPVILRALAPRRAPPDASPRGSVTRPCVSLPGRSRVAWRRSTRRAA